MSAQALTAVLERASAAEGCSREPASADESAPEAVPGAATASGPGADGEARGEPKPDRPVLHSELDELE